MLHPIIHMRGDVIDRRRCPVCDTIVLQRYRPGRARIYCTNACRQRAYRWRRRHGIRTCVERTGPAERATSFGVHHALRDQRDSAAAALSDHRRRHLTACGTFARPARFGRFTHNDFLPRQLWACKTCSDLVGAPDDPKVPEVPPVPHPLDRLRRQAESLTEPPAEPRAESPP
ncbi:MAG: hypothetical protein HKN41_01305 [Ilumatobacter sp.]|nr:hypothetical protein [Ilumatobacter sp.]